MRAAIAHLNQDVAAAGHRLAARRLRGDRRRACSARRRSTNAAADSSRACSAEAAGDPELHADLLRQPRRAAAARRCARSSSRASRARRAARGRRPRAGRSTCWPGPIIYRMLISGGDVAQLSGDPAELLERGARGASGLADLDAAASAHAERAAAGQQLEQLGADELAAPALQRAHVGLGLGRGGRRRRSARGRRARRSARRRARPPARARARATRRARSSGRRRPRSASRSPSLEPDRLGVAAALDRGDDVVAAAAHDVRA